MLNKIPEDLSIPEFLRRSPSIPAPVIPSAPDHAVEPAGKEYVHVLHRDYETRSRAILRKIGSHKYAVDPQTEILCAAYAVDNDPVQLWIPGDPVPAEFIEAARNPSWTVVAHNDAFENAIEQYVLHPRYGWPIVPP